MENNTEDKLNSIEKITNLAKRNKMIFLSFFLIIIIFIISSAFFHYYQNEQNDKISGKFIEAGIYLSKQDKEKSKNIYKDIILSKNEFYSSLALNNIIDNDLEKDNEEVLKLFKILENIKMNKDHKNLLKLKKALYLIKISKINEGEKMLQEIINEESSWKEIALEISKK